MPDPTVIRCLQQISRSADSLIHALQDDRDEMHRTVIQVLDMSVVLQFLI